MESKPLIHNPLPTSNHFAKVILPIAIPKPYTYFVPDSLKEDIQIGVRVEVQFGKSKLYSGIVIDLGPADQVPYKPKPILQIIDKKPIIYPQQVQLWQWMTDYYFCTLGEVMAAALPGGLKLTSETKITLHANYEEGFDELNDKEYLIAEALTLQHELSIKDIQDILDQKTIYPIIYSLIKKEILFVEEELKEKFRAKRVDVIIINEPFHTDSNLAFDLTSKSEKQTDALLALYSLAQQSGPIYKSTWYKQAQINTGIKNALINKGIISVISEEVSRLESYQKSDQPLPALTELQQSVIPVIHQAFAKNRPLLLHGVTGSGKTRVYLELVQETLERGEQCLFLLPEIALTKHIIGRLKTTFGKDIIVFHSKMSNAERVEVWNAILAGQSIVLGARSALFLPFVKLGLIIVDEEHDRSYKQDNPAPRYQARDLAVVLATRNKIPIILGTATPSFESYYNVQIGKYDIAHLPERIGELDLPTMNVVNLKEAHRKKQVHDGFSLELIEKIKATVQDQNQVILFQNRRGFSPFLRCTVCGWNATCIHCDVSQTYHKYFHKLICHYCNYQSTPLKRCPDCGSDQLTLKGLGTEKLEETLKAIFPLMRIKRMDLDTVKTKNSHEKILLDFEQKKLDILIGTQMVTKGLDFESVGLVGVINADSLIHFPDFRSHERAYQLITQVAGRAGRKNEVGEVVVQTAQPDHPVIRDVLHHRFASFYEREMLERQRFNYPPFYRLILVIIKHKKLDHCVNAAKQLAQHLRAQYGARIKGPTEPVISRIRNQYIRHVLIKMEKNAPLIAEIKSNIDEHISTIHQQSGMSTVRFNVNVDP